MFQEATYLWEDDDDRFSVENIPLYDSADDEPTSIPNDILLAKDEQITQGSNSNTVQSTENPGTASSNEFTTMAVEPLTASSNEFTPMTIEPLNAIPMGVDFIENGTTGYGAQYADDARTLTDSTRRNQHHRRRTLGEKEGGQWMATTRTAVARIPRPAWAAVAEALTRRMEGVGGGRAPRYFSDSTGRVLGEEERAAENVYIQKMEREKLEKLRRKADKDKADAAKRAAAGKGDKGEDARPT